MDNSNDFSNAPAFEEFLQELFPNESFGEMALNRLRSDDQFYQSVRVFAETYLPQLVDNLEAQNYLLSPLQNVLRNYLIDRTLIKAVYENENICTIDDPHAHEPTLTFTGSALLGMVYWLVTTAYLLYNQMRGSYREPAEMADVSMLMGQLFYGATKKMEEGDDSLLREAMGRYRQIFPEASDNGEGPETDDDLPYQ